jgi:hypothetical protein
MPTPANALVLHTRASTSLARVITPSAFVDATERDVAEQIEQKIAAKAGLATVRIADAMLAALLELKRA